MNPKLLIRRMRLGSALALVIFAVLSVVSYRAVRDLREGYYWVRHTHEVIEELEALLSSMQDIETGDRGYALVGEENMLEPYYSGLASAKQQLEHVREATIDNRGQQRRINVLSMLIDAKITSAGQIVRLRHENKQNEVAVVLRTGEGKRIMDDIRALILEMQTEERRLLVLREQAADRSTAQVRIILLTGIALIFLIVAVVAWMIRRDIQARWDISEQKRNQEALERKTLELKRSNDELQQFAYVASHDLQEPLRMVASYTQLLAKRYHGRLDSDANEFITYAVDGANRMQRLIHDLLSYSRVGTQGKELRPTSSEDSLKLALSNLERSIRETGARVEHGRLPMVLADDMQLVQLFQNLVGNAIKYHGPEPPVVNVSCAKNGDRHWTFSVADNGIGISPNYFDRIFIMFQRLHGRDDFSGTGIGLTVCKKIVERHGGRIWVESAPGQGSNFQFTLPEMETK